MRGSLKEERALVRKPSENQCSFFVAAFSCEDIYQNHNLLKQNLKFAQCVSCYLFLYKGTSCPKSLMPKVGCTQTQKVVQWSTPKGHQRNEKNCKK